MLINNFSKSDVININNSTIILKPKVDFKTSFDELQLKKQSNNVDNSEWSKFLIMHDTGAFIPAGIYDSYDDLSKMIDYLHDLDLKKEDPNKEEIIKEAVSKIVLSIATTPGGDMSYFSTFNYWKAAFEKWHDGIEVDDKMQKAALKSFFNIYNSSSIKKIKENKTKNYTLV